MLPRKRKAAPEPEPTVSDLEPSKMKVAELKEELTKRGLSLDTDTDPVAQYLDLEDDDGSPPLKKTKTIVLFSHETVKESPVMNTSHHNENEEEVRSKLATTLEEIDNSVPVVKLDSQTRVTRRVCKSIVTPCALDQPTQNLIKLIFNKTMFNKAMKNLRIDIKKVSFGGLSRTHIAEGFGVLETIENGIKNKIGGYKLAMLTMRFCEMFPQTLPRGTTKHRVIKDLKILQEKYDMLLVLKDIETAQDLLQKVTTKKSILRLNYESLKAGLVHVDKVGEEYALLEKYLSATAPQWRTVQILDIWKVDRDGANDRFACHDAIANRRLLWHGTNVAVVAAILKSGLRIMPHSGGRVGKGIYFASECSKSAADVRTSSKGFGFMFLTEVALGKEYHTLREEPTLTQPPSGFDSVIAQGDTEPDPKDDTSIVLEGKTVTVPQGKPILLSELSSFSQSEYVVYKESQARIRYLLKLKFS